MAFRPARRPGAQLGDLITRARLRQFTRAIDFFQLFFTFEIVSSIADNTNIYGWLNILNKPTYSTGDGSWIETSPAEIYRFIGLIIYMGFVQVPSFSRYWSTTPPYVGLWARQFMSRDRFKALLGMIHVSDPSTDQPGDRLCKIRPLIAHMKQKCKELYQCKVNVSVDERMVKSKGRSGIRQFIANKPVRFGFKLWVLAESDTGYTLDFNVYTGRRERPSAYGLGHDVVVTLCQSLVNQGYRVYFDNFYTSPQLLLSLYDFWHFWHVVPAKRTVLDYLIW